MGEPAACPLGDIDDAQAFAAAAVARLGLRLPADERDELVAEGVAALCALHAGYRRTYDDFARPPAERRGARNGGSFAGYAARYLPGKLLDAWHRAHPEHVARARPDGTRYYEYHDPATAYDPDSHEPAHQPVYLCDIAQGNGYRGTDRVALTGPAAAALGRRLDALAPSAAAPAPAAATYTVPINRALGDALRGQVQAEHEFTLRVAVLRTAGLGRRAIAQALGASDVEVRMAHMRLDRIAPDA